MMKQLLIIAGFWGLVGCSSVTPVMNQPTTIKASEYSPKVPIEKKTQDIMLILTFSGGGTRAAALSYGVLKGLRDTNIPQRNRLVNLLSKVDVISGVSGGSFTAAYYGLFGENIFRDYEHVFLKQPVQSALIDNWLLTPSNWGKLGSDRFNRTDLAAEYYDSTIFEGKTFGEMRADMPFIIINTTDISAGTAFSFTPETMRWICSDLDSYPVSRAVAASSAVPGAFTPITLKNHSGCQPFSYQNTDVSPKMRRDAQALGVLKYQDKKRFPYVHLVDGGVSDNLGIRAILHMVAQQGGSFPQLLKTYGIEKIKKVVVIAVNSSDDIPPRIAQTPADPGIEDTLSAVMTIQSRRYNTDTLDLLGEEMQKWKTQMRTGRCLRKGSANCRTPAFYLIELNLKQLPKTMAEEASLYATSLELPEQQVDTLVYAGQFLLKNSPEFLRLVREIKAGQ